MTNVEECAGCAKNYAGNCMRKPQAAIVFEA